MRSFSRCRALGLAAALLWWGAWAPAARAQTAAQGFAVERLYQSAPGAGWVVMDALDMRGGLGGVMALTLGYASDPLQIGDGSNRVAAVSDQAFANFGFAVTYDRWRLYLNLDVPLAIQGQSGTVGGYAFTAPGVELGSRPDGISDPRLGLDVRLLGGPRSVFRLGAGAQVIFPTGNRLDYNSDGTFRGMLRALCAGDVGMISYACQLGVHIRPLDDGPAPGSPQGSELLYGAAGGLKLPVGSQSLRVVLGPEIFGATAFRGGDTALEALLSGRIEGTRDDGMQFRVKLGLGVGITQQFGAPGWRLVAGVEVFNHRAGR